MKISRLLITVSALSLLLAPVVAHADTCAATSLSNILGTTCTIGDKTFTFNPADQNSFTGITAAQLLFTPDTSNPLSPGFSFSLASGGPLSVASTSGQQRINVAVNYTVSVTNGTASILGDTFTLFGATVTPSGKTGDNAISDATNFFAGIFGASAEVFLQCQIPAGPTGCTTPSGPSDLTATGTLAAPVISATGQAGFELLAETINGSVSASLSSVSYNFNQLPTGVPEPSSLALIGIGLVGIRGVRRRFKLHN